MSEQAPDARPALSSWIVLALLAALPASFATGFSSYEALRGQLLIVVGGAALLAWGVETARARRLALSAGRASLLLLAFALYTALSVAWSVNPLYGLTEALPVFMMGALAMIVLAPTRGPLTSSALLGAASLGTALAGLMGILDRVGLSIFSVIWDAPGPAGAFDGLEGAIAYYAIALALCAGALGAPGAPARRALGGAGLLLGAAHLGLFASPGALALLLIVGVICGAGALALRAARPAGLALLGGLAITFVTAALVPRQVEHNWANDLPVIDAIQRDITTATKREELEQHTRFAMMRHEDLPQDPQARELLVSWSVDRAMARPLIGLGAGGWWLDQSPVMTVVHPFLAGKFNHYVTFRTPHSAWAKLAVEQGAPGLVLLLGWLIAALVLGVARLRPRADAAEATPADPGAGLVWALLSAAILGAAIMVTTSALSFAAAGALWFIALAGLAREAARAGAGGGWGATWHAHQSPRAVAVGGVFAAALALGAIVPGALDAVAGYWRGAGDQLMLKNRSVEARDPYLTAHAIYPAHAEVLYNVSLTAYRSGHVEEFLDELREARTLRPHDARILLLLAQGESRRRQVTAAMGAAEQARLRAPHMLDAYKLLAGLHYARNEMQQTADMIKASIALEPPPQALGSLHEQLADMYDISLKRPALALEQYALALKYLDAPFVRERIQDRVDELTKRLERERLQREGKPIPEGLMPKGDHDGHNHGPGDGHDHGAPPSPMGLPPGAPGQRPNPELLKRLMEQRQQEQPQEAPAAPQ